MGGKMLCQMSSFLECAIHHLETEFDFEYMLALPLLSFCFFRILDHPLIIKRQES